MQASSMLTYVWPGLPQLWWRGNWRALAVAVGFAIAVNLGLVSHFLWPEMLPSSVTKLGWVVLLVTWGTVCWRGRQCGIAVQSEERPTQTEPIFVQAQDEYLKGHWLETERLLQRVLELDERDLDARLMLAALYRRTGRANDSERKLRILERMDGSEKWTLEIARERKLLRQAEQPAASLVEGSIP